jgi:hypothetical protein
MTQVLENDIPPTHVLGGSFVLNITLLLGLESVSSERKFSILKNSALPFEAELRLISVSLKQCQHPHVNIPISVD